MKNFPKHFDPSIGVAVVKLRFQVAVAVELSDRKVGYGKTASQARIQS